MLQWFPALQNFVMLNKVNNTSKHINSSKFQSILKLGVEKAVPFWKREKRNKRTATVSQAPAVGHCGRQWGCPSPATLPFILLHEKEGSGHWGPALSGNSAQGQLPNHCPFPPTYTRFSATKSIQASSTKSPTFKGFWDPMSQHMSVA